MAKKRSHDSVICVDLTEDDEGELEDEKLGDGHKKLKRSPSSAVAAAHAEVKAEEGQASGTTARARISVDDDDDGGGKIGSCAALQHQESSEVPVIEAVVPVLRRGKSLKSEDARDIVRVLVPPFFASFALAIPSIDEFDKYRYADRLGRRLKKEMENLGVENTFCERLILFPILGTGKGAITRSGVSRGGHYSLVAAVNLGDGGDVDSCYGEPGFPSSWAQNMRLIHVDTSTHHQEVETYIVPKVLACLNKLWELAEPDKSGQANSPFTSGGDVIKPKVPLQGPETKVCGLLMCKYVEKLCRLFQGGGSPSMEYILSCLSKKE